MHPEPQDELRTATFRDLETTTLYAILRLRSDVFVVEQECVYADLDGRDDEPGTRHLWFTRDGEIRAYVRILDDGDTLRIGRVVTAKSARGAGLAARLMDEALTIVGDRPSVLDAQAYLVDFYAKFGYQQTGPEYIEDGIPHIPMAREA
ncbi:GNAT family N-acetyltransferase [Actinoplanes bogorensis]|uniref:GNAT family N-acetyltransferase n=1 Tax=Paractinoplanes bogorensis TaxID=1610840 RepID=A0ABS5YG91_9ACTN|nr:GNAT family N-acetyltransferase [Actinoplanes bogorensis]MBU2662387.1 GNAT family N-acetyltransferase [Actinoplanes bogorensis]